MKVGGKDIESLPSKEDPCPKVPLQKINSTYTPLKISEPPLDTSKRQTTGNPEPSQWVGEKDEVSTLESTPAITEEAIKALATVHKNMEAASEEFKNFK
ncbi:hypothetical protein E5676_scaffold232G00500 [Cucumis melo var. makuwa]|uniref:Uncharacterized protein n=1 Tax=Cucumis melo var. makuwa TaxID=1194695 RepID=A0A5D3BH15_CUCMM|nr:hypothetical protein E5676_scaffold232G00500 [Cucumis melo var. makuwa]